MSEVDITLALQRINDIIVSLDFSAGTVKWVSPDMISLPNFGEVEVETPFAFIESSDNLSFQQDGNPVNQQTVIFPVRVWYVRDIPLNAVVGEIMHQDCVKMYEAFHRDRLAIGGSNQVNRIDFINLDWSADNMFNKASLENDWGLIAASAEFNLVRFIAR